MFECLSAFVHGVDLVLLCAEAEHVIAQPALNNLVQIHKCTATNEQDVLGVYADVFLLRMFAPALGWNIAGSTF